MYSVTIRAPRLFRQGNATQLVRLQQLVIGRWCIIALLLCCMVHAGAQSYFRTESGTPYVQGGSIFPTPTSAGAMYVNSDDNKLYWYTGNQWMTVAAAVAVTAPDGTAIVNITSPSGRVWMDRNLGASRAPTSNNDYLAYGSLFQWCRAADGHQLMNWTGNTVGTTVNGTAVNGTTSTKSTGSTAPNSLFITASASPYDWLNTQQPDGSLWWNGTTAGANSPCPAGYHVPTLAEWQGEWASTLVALNFALPSCHRGSNNGLFSIDSFQGLYWTSSVQGTSGVGISTNGSGSLNILYTNRANGICVRCIKNL